MQRLSVGRNGEVVHVAGWKSSPCLDVGTGTVVPLQSPARLISLNTGMKVLSDRALFYVDKLTAALE